MEKINISKQLEVIKRGAVEIISEDELRFKLEESIRLKRPLKVKAGFDPTAPDIHLGHTVLLNKLKAFQELGHKVIFLIGDFTARIGDPSGQSKIRKALTAEEIKNNASTYKKQVFKILDAGKTRIMFNSKWFDKMTGLEFGKLLTHYTVTRLLERDDFALRIKEQKPLFMSEFIYPIFQGYDSVVLEADIEIGGTDQKFNLIVGRELQKDFGQAPQVIITLPLLEGTDGEQKMSKTYANYIGINEAPGEMFGKIMSIPDKLMMKYYQLLTAENLEPIKSMHPKEAKSRLARIIVERYYSQKQAASAESEFERVFSRRELPQDIAAYKLISGGNNIIEILLEGGLVRTKNEARRLIQQKAVSLNSQCIDKEGSSINQEGVLKVGKRRFLKLIK
ncbi:MAG: tyrosine--tRNA ligase [Candidatus Omnitrophica bacterium]|nr:tyrosine--tRNA ligase [Candidatus Omnitrophota bacterium]